MAERAAAWPLERIRAVMAEVARDEYRGDDEALPKPGVWWPDCSRDECGVRGHCAHPDGALYEPNDEPGKVPVIAASRMPTDRLYAADVIDYSDLTRRKQTVWIEQIAGTDTATIFFPSER
jgi:hypothetical protein